MPIVAELRLSAPDLFLGAASRATPDVTVHVVHQAGVAGLLFSAIGEDLDAFERALANDPTIEDHRIVSDVDGGRFYVGNVALERPFFSGLAVTEGIVIMENELVEGEWTLRLQLPDRESLARLVEFSREHDIAMSVDRLYVEDPSGDAGRFGLTPAQRDALLAAKEHGYFEDPRDVTLEELADELGVSSTALGRRMRRAISALVERTLESER